MIKKYIAIFSLGVFIVLMISSCGTEAPAPWPWWTKDDTTAVNNELTAWQDTFNGYNFIRGQNGSLNYPININIPIFGSDTISQTGVDFVKIAHLTGFNNVLSDSVHFNEYTFGVKNDTIPGDSWPRDTFCYVTYKDSTVNCIGVLQFDTTWTVKFYPDTTIDTTQAPPETIITYKVDTIYKTGFSSTQEEQDTYSFATMRKLELKKEIGQLKYNLKYLTGFGMYVPNTTVAPTISYIILTKPGRSDTFRYSPRTDGKGIYNLKHKDSVYTLAPNESVNVHVVIPTSTDSNYFFVGLGNPFITNKSHISTSGHSGVTQIAFANQGLAHLFVEVIPASAIFYPYTAQWKSATWAIPIRIKQ